MQRHVQIEILGLALLLVLLSWVSPQPPAHAKEAPGRPLNHGRNSFTDGTAKYLLAKHDRTSANESETRAETSSGNTPDDTSENRSNSQSNSSASDGAAQPSAQGEQHTLLYYAIQAIGILIGGTILLALISSSSIIFLATIWHTLKLMNGGKKPSIG